MNLTIDRDRNTQFQTVIGNSLRKKKKESEKLSGEQLMINQFKEQNSRENNRIAEIYGKFRAGKKLSPEEMDYIAKEAPELYRQVREILMERQALERQMEMAESKEEVAQIHANQLNKIQASMGTGEEAEGNAEINMARANHTMAAFQEFTASVEYKEKEDNESRAKESRDLLKELEREQEMYRDKIAENIEAAESLSEDIEEESQNPIVEEMVEEALEFEDKEQEVRRRKRGRKGNATLNDPFITASVDLKDLQLKVRELYRSERSSVTKTESSKGKGVDLSL